MRVFFSDLTQETATILDRQLFRISFVAIHIVFYTLILTS